MRVYCGKVNQEHLGKTIELYGWVKKIRKFGSLLFLDLYDKTGIMQITMQENHKLFNDIVHLSKESVIYVKGEVVLRSNPNKEIPTGLYELKLEDLEIISVANNTPFVIDEETDANEDIRMKYRYLDLRRNVVKEKILLRAKIIQAIREFLISQNFEEIETPFLCRPTPEGAKDYLVPTRNQLEKFYALPQSPQTFKQLLMIAGFDRYFQIARCFRDEPLRADRQPEFTQVDLELSFTNELEIQTIVENLLKYVFKKVLNIDLVTPFERMDYDVAMNSYGCDKPDLRFENKIQDVSSYFEKTNFKIIQEALKENKKVKCLIFENISASKKDIVTLEKFAKDNQAKGLMWLNVQNKEIKEGSIAKVVEPEIIAKIFADNKIDSGLILLVVDTNDVVNKALGAVRLETARMFNLIKENIYKFLWIVNWPLFEYDDKENRYVAAHHPFTSPTLETIDTFDKNMKDAKARSYDIVLNGYEVGGGSIRIHNQDVQKRMFDALKLSEAEIQNKFGYFLEAFKYGVPTHGGLALGLDRLMMLITNANSIKDVIAFPKNSAGIDTMMEAPNKMSNEDLSELGLSFKTKK